MLSQTTGRSVTTTEAQSIISMLQNTRQRKKTAHLQPQNATKLWIYSGTTTAIPLLNYSDSRDPTYKPGIDFFGCPA